MMMAFVTTIPLLAIMSVGAWMVCDTLNEINEKERELERKRLQRGLRCH